MVFNMVYTDVVAGWGEVVEWVSWGAGERGSPRQTAEETSRSRGDFIVSRS